MIFGESLADSVSHNGYVFAPLMNRGIVFRKRRI